MSIDLTTLTVIKAHEALMKGDYTARQLAQAYLDQISARNTQLNAYLEVYADVLAQADAADARIKAGTATLFTGIPVALKDNILLKGHIASASSKMLEKYHATYDATAVAKLRAEGAVFLGRTNMDEFAMGGSTENSAFGPTKNPHDPTRVAGGSSGGSAAAVAMNGALVALGTDTGGSVRQPASFCGIVALKPTYGAISRSGIMAMGSSLDQVGPMTKTVRDCELLFDALAGTDPLDSTTIAPTTYAATQKDSEAKRAAGKKPVIGVPRSFLKGDGIDPIVLKNFEESLEKFRALGYEVRDVELPNIGYSLAVYYIVMPAEVSSNLARFDGVKYGLTMAGKDIKDEYFMTRAAGFGKEVRRRILLGTYVLSSGYYDAYYTKANAVRELITSDFTKAFENVDIIVTPTTPAPAFKLGEKTSDPMAMYLEDIFTVTANLTGMPALAIPSGTTSSTAESAAGPVALPLGIQMTARKGDEKSLFSAGKDFLGE